MFKRKSEPVKTEEVKIVETVKKEDMIEFSNLILKIKEHEKTIDYLNKELKNKQEVVERFLNKEYEDFVKENGEYRISLQQAYSGYGSDYKWSFTVDRAVCAYDYDKGVRYEIVRSFDTEDEAKKFLDDIQRLGR
jgi:hypothetical protein